MGYYMNPPEGKRAWLQNHAIPVDGDLRKYRFDDKTTLLCLVSNLAFDALCIVHNKYELAEFIVNDGRPHAWFLAETSDVLAVCPEAEHVLS